MTNDIEHMIPSEIPSIIDTRLSGILQNKQGLIFFSVNHSGNTSKVAYNRQCSFLWHFYGLTFFRSTDIGEQILSLMETKDKRFKKQRIAIVLRAMKDLTQKESKHSHTSTPFGWAYYNTTTNRLTYTAIESGKIVKSFCRDAEEPILYLMGIGSQRPFTWNKEEFEAYSVLELVKMAAKIVEECLKEEMSEGMPGLEYVEWISYDFKKKEIQKGKSYLEHFSEEEAKVYNR